MVTRSVQGHFPMAGSPGRDVLGRAWQRVSLMLQARATRRLLMEMEPRLLADIGVGRGDAIEEANRPFWSVDGLR